MNFAQLLAPYVSYADVTLPDIEITGLVTDHREVNPGDCFIALAGTTHHGKAFIDDAIRHGASAVLLEIDGAVKDFSSISYRTNIPVIALPSLKSLVNNILIDFYQQQEVAFKLPLLAVTGTNGKSSITRFTAQMSHGLQQPTGLMGTLGFGVWPNIVESKNTTPELAVLLRQFALMKHQGAEQVAMEVSSHGIKQKRIEGLVFDAAVFANLSQDHLDYHGDMESYFSIKRELFLSPGLQHAIINADDEYGQRLLADDEIEAQKISYGFSESADVRVTNWATKGASIEATISTPWGDADFGINMLGDFNLANVLAAISLLAVAGKFSFAAIIDSIACITPAPGRMQAYSKKGCANAVVDFAHTPDALLNVLTTLKKQSTGKLALVFGCGGNRDADKRPQMAKIAEEIADVITITADNPRKEKLETIIADIQSGLDPNSNTRVKVEWDRAQAITSALAELTSNDLLLIAGKGHEDYQDIDGVKIPYSDKGVLLSLGYQDVTQLEQLHSDKEAL